jgi:hypothetical protein
MTLESQSMMLDVGMVHCLDITLYTNGQDHGMRANPAFQRLKRPRV